MSDATFGDNAAPLAGVRVIDFSRVLAGPMCGQLLADHGADVIKVEQPGGDENRRWLPQIGSVSLNFLAVNRGKRGMTLNLKAPESSAVLAKLVASADIVLESYLPADAARLNMTHDDLIKLNSQIVHVSITGYPYDGPYRDKPGYDLVTQAAIGIMMVTGRPGDPPMRAGASVVDLTAGMLAFGGAVTALLRAREGHGGEHVKVSLLQAGMALMSYYVTNYTVGGVAPTRNGSGHGSLVPYQAFECADGPVLIGVTNDAAFERLKCALGNPLGLADQRFRTAAGRIEHRDSVIAAVQEIVRGEPREKVLASLAAAQIPSSPVYSLPEAIESPEVVESDILQTIVLPSVGDVSVLGRPISYGSDFRGADRPPPVLGADTAEILESLGLSPEEIRDLRKKSVV